MTTEAESKPASWMAEELLAEKDRIKRAADMAAAGAQAEAQRIKAKMPLPPAASEGMFEVRFVQAVIEIIGLRHSKYKDALVQLSRTRDGSEPSYWGEF